MGRVVSAYVPNFLTCDKQGWQWVISSSMGDVFMFAQVVVVVMQAVMIEKVFCAVPHHNGAYMTQE